MVSYVLGLNFCQVSDSAKEIPGFRMEFYGCFPDSDSEPRKSVAEKITGFLLGNTKKINLVRPVSIAVQNEKNFWIADQENRLLFNIVKGVGEITQLKSKSEASFPSLVGLCGFGGEHILFTDSYLNGVFRLDTRKKSVIRFSDTLKLNRPTGIVWSPVTRYIWVAETGAHRLVIFDEKGRIIKTVGKRGTGPGDFNFPAALCTDQVGKVYVVDAMNYRIQVFSPEGDFLFQFGKQGDATGDFARPKGVAADRLGNIYVVDALFHNVQVFDKSGRLLTYFGRQGQGKGEFWMPSGIFIDRQDLVYIADSYNSRVQIFRLIPEQNK